jgi:hypothetical protein
MSKDITMNQLKLKTDNLLNWLSQNGWQGWDPYDIKGSDIGIYLQSQPRTFIKKCFNKAFHYTTILWPITTRKLCRIHPQINAKGMGLLLGSYAQLHQLHPNNTAYLDEATDIANWLINHRVTTYSGYSWGYPFDWQSCIFIPKNTPSSVVSSTIGDGFYQLYLATKNTKYLDICKEICTFFIENLKITYNKNGGTCRSYTPIDDYQVHNANLFVAEFLARIGKETQHQAWLDEALSLAQFALNEQQPDGFLPYWGLEQTNQYSNGKINSDHYHSGFEIRCLYQLWKHTEYEPLKKAYSRYFDWYNNHMFQNNTKPLIKPNQLYPINIHACAESILCRSKLLPDHPEFEGQILQTLEWISKTMEYKPGQYTYIRQKLLGIPISSKIPMLRWGQAWMLRSLSEYAFQLKNLEKTNLTS